MQIEVSMQRELFQFVRSEATGEPTFFSTGSDGRCVPVWEKLLPGIDPCGKDFTVVRSYLVGLCGALAGAELFTPLKDLGVFSAAVGSAQKLPNGNYHFDAGWVNGNSAISYEGDQLGNTIRAIQAGALEYRTFRMRDLYTPN